MLRFFISIVEYNFWKHYFSLAAMILVSYFVKVTQTPIDKSVFLYFIGIITLAYFIFFIFNLIFLVILSSNKLTNKLNDYIKINLSQELLPLDLQVVQTHIYKYSAWCFISLIVIISYLVTFAYGWLLIDTVCNQGFGLSPLDVMADIAFVFTLKIGSTIDCVSSVYPGIRTIIRILGVFCVIFALIKRLLN